MRPRLLLSGVAASFTYGCYLLSVRQSSVHNDEELLLGVPAQSCRWGTGAAPRRPLLPAETGTAASVLVERFLAFLEEHVRVLGYNFTLVDGTLLGAVRHGGLIPGDRDLDVLVLLPPGEGVPELYSRLGARLAAAGHPLQLELAEGGESSWLRLLPWVQDASEGKPVAADLLAMPASTFGDAGFGALCRCRLGKLQARRCPRLDPAGRPSHELAAGFHL